MSFNTVDSIYYRGTCLGLSSIYGPDYPGEHFLDDLAYLCGLSTCSDVFGDQWLTFSSRGISEVIYLMFPLNGRAVG